MLDAMHVIRSFVCVALQNTRLIKVQRFAFKFATNKNIKTIAGLRPAILLVTGLIEHWCKTKMIF
jgi:hypothetical protein